MRQVSGSLSYWLYFPLAVAELSQPLACGSGPGRAICPWPVDELDRGFVADRAVRSLLILFGAVLLWACYYYRYGYLELKREPEETRETKQKDSVLFGTPIEPSGQKPT